MSKITFEWDDNKDKLNQEKHEVAFSKAQKAFLDPKRIIAEDLEHSKIEKRYYCFGLVDNGVMTVRFTYRGHIVRMIGAGYWRKGKKIYEASQSQVHK
jgi:uncharacterized protein